MGRSRCRWLILAFCVRRAGVFYFFSDFVVTGVLSSDAMV